MVPLHRRIAKMIHHDHQQQSSSSKSGQMHLFIVYEIPMHSSKFRPRHRKRSHSHYLTDKSPLSKMASSSPSSSSNPSALAMTEEEFRAFHNIDRKLYTLLVGSLGRDPAQSMQIMALWLWLERTSRDQTLVQRMLDLPVELINGLAEEAVLILNCVEQDEFRLTPEELNSWDVIPLTQYIVSKMDVSMPYFHGSRLGVVRGVTQFVNEVCVRAFHNVMKNAAAARTLNFAMPTTGSSDRPESSSRSNYQYQMPIVIGNVPLYGLVSFYGFGPGVGLVPPSMSQNVASTIDPTVETSERTNAEFGADASAAEIAPAPVMYQATNPYDLPAQRQLLRGEELSHLMRYMNLQSGGDDDDDQGENENINADQEQVEEDNAVPPDDRTVFLTFSRGYDVTMDEVGEFFTRIYGDCIEAIIAQEVAPNEQALFARMVIRTSSLLDAILNGEQKAKFVINKKHVWARKYVKKVKPRR